MKRRKEVAEILWNLGREIPGFKSEDLLQYTEWAIPKLYNSLKNKERLEVKCTSELINKLNEQSLKYRITENMDHISVQFVELFDNIKKDNEIYIQVYVSIYFYDKVKNNIDDESKNDKYWNDIWIVTYREGIESKRNNSNCANCGAIMKYNQMSNIFECEYCGNIIHDKFNSKREIIDIELYD